MKTKEKPTFPEKLHLVGKDDYKMTTQVLFCLADLKGYYLKVHESGEVWIREDKQGTYRKQLGKIYFDDGVVISSKVVLKIISALLKISEKSGLFYREGTRMD